MTIIDRKVVQKLRFKDNHSYISNEKHYKYRCNNCGWECENYYVSGIYNEEYWVKESSLYNHGVGCVVCCNTPKFIVPEINSIISSKETKLMIQYFQGEEDEAKKYSPGCNKKIFPVCPICNRIKTCPILINIIHRERSIGCICSDNISYPNKFIFTFLTQLTNIEFYPEQMFRWSELKKYDEYIIYNNVNIIIENHGRQHYEDGFQYVNGRTYIEEHNNDIHKRKLAIKNLTSEENYIILDCRESNMEWIKKSIMESKLPVILNFSESDIDWEKCDRFAISTRVKEACEYWNSGIHSTIKIAKLMKNNCNTVTQYLKRGNEIGWCNYKVKKEVEVFRNGLSMGVFESSKLIEEKSKELFGVQLNHSSISNVCIGKTQQHKGYQFQYVKRDKSGNKIKQELPKIKYKKYREKPIEIFKDNISLGVFESVKELCAKCLDKYSIKLFESNVAAVARGKLTSYKGFRFKYV
ncbi:hypothetical protein DVV88_10335 [Clostridium botulinum]|nr:hypothetical protein [Clostridium botulinum]